MKKLDLDHAVERLAGSLPEPPEALLVLGSGLARVAERVEDPVVLPFSELPGFPPAGVAGHPGRFVGGRMEGRPVLLQAGRLHLYEGHPPAVVVAPVRIAARLGIRTAVFTNASGGIHPDLVAGSLVLIDDHLNHTWRSPLAGRTEEGEERFPDMSRPYDIRLQALTLETGARLRIPLMRGTYGGVLGPSYETPAEIEMLRRMGADIVGMSTVAEVLAARASAMRVLAVSLVTNRAASRHGPPLTHEGVLEAAREGSVRLETLLRGILKGLDSDG